jgi:pyruvate dehydrogenase E2 component (dihydrolipoamide acetyltransferase)
VIAFVAAEDETVPALPPLPAGDTAVSPPPTAVSPHLPPLGAIPSAEGKVRATPAARSAARELGVDLSEVSGTGPEGRVSEADVRAHHAARERR